MRAQPPGGRRLTLDVALQGRGANERHRIGWAALQEPPEHRQGQRLSRLPWWSRNRHRYRQLAQVAPHDSGPLEAGERGEHVRLRALGKRPGKGRTDLLAPVVRLEPEGRKAQG